MSLLGRIKSALSAKANAALDKAIDPEKEMDMAIAELEDTNLEARKELLSYKTTKKQIEQDIAVCDEKIAKWEERAMEAVKFGDDELAKEALTKKRELEVSRKEMIRDRNEADSYAIQLNKSRKLVETRLKILKLKRGTMAQQIAAARAGGQVFGDDGGVWEKMKRAEERIEEQAIAAEVDELLGMEEAQSGEALAALESQTKEVGAESALAELKAKMDKDKKKLPPKKE
jgi:phage shock protein A